MRYILFAIVYPCVWFFVNSGQKESKREPKTYPVNMSFAEWDKYAGGIKLTMELIRQSDLPAKQVSFLTDSVLAPLFIQINQQVGGQVDAERKAADSASKKNNIPKKN